MTGLPEEDKLRHPVGMFPFGFWAIKIFPSRESTAATALSIIISCFFTLFLSYCHVFKTDID